MVITTRDAIRWLVALAAAPRALAQDFNACLEKLRTDAVARGITPETFDTAMTGIEPDQSVLDAMDPQPEFTTPIWDYLAGLVDDQRSSASGESMARHSPGAAAPRYWCLRARKVRRSSSSETSTPSSATTPPCPTHPRRHPVVSTIGRAGRGRRAGARVLRALQTSAPLEGKPASDSNEPLVEQP